MPVEETKHDLTLKRIQITLAILASLTAVIVGIYNIKKSYFEKPAPKAPEPQAAHSDKIRSTLEDVGASWLETLKKKREQ